MNFSNILLVIAATLTALVAGLFYAWSVSITLGLARVSDLRIYFRDAIHKSCDSKSSVFYSIFRSTDSFADLRLFVLWAFFAFLAFTCGDNYLHGWRDGCYDLWKCSDE